MAKPYSMDLRERVVVAILAGASGVFERGASSKAAVAVLETRMRLPACLLRRWRREQGHRQSDRLLQQQPPAHRAWRCAPSRCILRSTVGLGGVTM